MSNLLSERSCSNCGSNSTYTDYYRGYPHKQWYNHDGEWYCADCNNRLFKNPKWNPINNPKYNDKHLQFKDKQVLLTNNPRTGICKDCEKKIGDTYTDHYGKTKLIKKTDMHHIQYHEDEPLKDTKELCSSCHGKESWRLRHE